MHGVGRVGDIISSRKAGAVAAAAWSAILLGCMSLTIGGRHVTTGLHADGTFLQEGQVRLPPACEQDVYYPIPYACPPNLEIDCALHCTIVHQKEDHFRIQNTDPFFSRTVGWKARGVKGPPPALVGPPPALVGPPPPWPALAPAP